MSLLIFQVLYAVVIFGVLLLLAVYFIIATFFRDAYSPYRYNLGKVRLAAASVNKVDLFARLEEFDMTEAAKEFSRTRKVQHTVYQSIILLLSFITRHTPLANRTLIKLSVHNETIRTNRRG